MTLNRKGYMLVEIIIAAVLAASIAFFLLNLTYEFKNKTEDIMQSHIYTKEKMLITKNIMSDLEKGIVYPFHYIDNNDEIIIYLEYQSKENIDDELEYRVLEIKTTNKTIIKYGKVEPIEGGYTFDVNHISYYEKELSASLVVKDIEITPITSGSNSLYNMSIKIPIESIYDNNDYSIKLFIYVRELKPE